MKLRIYCGIKPSPPYDDPAELIDRIHNLLGPAVVDRSGWALLRPGLLSPRLVLDVCRAWRVKRSYCSVYGRPQLMGRWVVFDYLFAKGTMTNPVVRCLANMGLVRYDKATLPLRLPNTYLVTACLNYDLGLLLMLYNGRKVERELDNLAYIIGHMIKAREPRLVEIGKRLIINFASHLADSPAWKLRGWISKEGRSIELDLIYRNREEYLKKLKSGDWHTLLFQSSQAKVKLVLGRKVKAVNVSIRKRLYKPGPGRDIRAVLDDIAKAVMLSRTKTVMPAMEDDAGILRAYTERRGIMAALQFEKKHTGREPLDVSYEFVGYDIRSEPYLIEVKAFRDTASTIELTENEYETMSREENYRLYIVEDAWSDIPKINIIENPHELLFTAQDRQWLESRIAFKKLFTCDEERWRRAVKYHEFVRI